MSEAGLLTTAHHVPFFITPSGETDVLFYAVAIFVGVVILLIGVLYLRLHALPEHMAHRTDKVQFQVVAVLALLALFTHNNLYWVAALLLAMIRLPDFSTPLQGMASSLAKLADRRRSPSTIEPSPVTAPVPHLQQPSIEATRQVSPEMEVKELSHV